MRHSDTFLVAMDDVNPRLSREAYIVNIAKGTVYGPVAVQSAVAHMNGAVWDTVKSIMPAVKKLIEAKRVEK